MNANREILARREALALLHALQDAGHAVRRDDTGEQPRIMIGPPPTAEMAAQIRQHREGLLYVLEQGWPEEERAALEAWQAWNRAVEARPVEVSARRRARTKPVVPVVDDLLEEPP